MTTNDPNLIKTPINKDDDTQHIAADNDDKLVDTPHVKEGDKPARSPDRRDQEGNAFDDGINENKAASADRSEPKSDEITDYNRYASVDNAQSRVLNETDKD